MTEEGQEILQRQSGLGLFGVSRQQTQQAEGPALVLNGINRKGRSQGGDSQGGCNVFPGNLLKLPGA